MDAKIKNMLDQTIEDSFPASDPSSSTPVTGISSDEHITHHVDGDSNYNYKRFDVRHYDVMHFNGPKKDDQAPIFLANSLAGMQVGLSDFKGQLVVLQTGSLSCPDFMANVDAMNALAEKFPSAKFIVLYVRETHPGKNPAHRSMLDKQKAAMSLKHDHGENRLILLDDLKGTIHRAFGAFPNMVYVIDPSGKIVYRSSRTIIDEVQIILSGLCIQSKPLEEGLITVFEPKPKWMMRILIDSGVVALWRFVKTLPSLFRIKRKIEGRGETRQPLWMRSEF